MTPIQQASYQSRRLKTIARQMTDMAADWGDIDNYFLQQNYEANKMQTRLPYGTNVKKIREECLTEYANWTPPTGEEIKAALSMAGWTGVEFSKRAGVDDRTVRRWTGDEKEIPYAAWCVLCAEANLGLIW